MRSKLTTLCYIEKDNKYLMLHRVKKENTLPLWEGAKIFLNLLDTTTDFFSLKLRYEGEKLVENVVKMY